MGGSVPALVPSLVPGDAFKIIKPSCPLPYQNSKLTRSIACVETLREANEKRAAEQKRKSIEDALKDVFMGEFHQWERDAYIVGKEITMQSCGTKERRPAYITRCSYIMDSDPRFNGEHAAIGYEGVVQDPCDPQNNCGWLLNIGVGKPRVRLGRGMRRS